jgi:hypothetical protein
MEPLFQMLRAAIKTIGARDPAKIEAQCIGFGREIRFEAFL